MESRRLYRSRHDRVIGGVAGGLGDYFDVDPTIVRLAWVVALLAGILPAIVAYVAGCLLIPDEPILD